MIYTIKCSKCGHTTEQEDRPRLGVLHVCPECLHAGKLREEPQRSADADGIIKDDQ